MATVALTDKRVRDLQPVATVAFLWDAKLPGFGVRVTPAGSKAFVLSYRSGRRSRRTTIGRVGEMSLSAARETAKEMLVAVRKGADPVAERAARRTALTLGALIDRWMKEHSEINNRQSTVKHQQALIRRNLSGPLAAIAAVEITAVDIEKIKTRLRSKPVEFNRFLALLRAAYNFALKRELVERNPTGPVARYREQPRDRILSADELRRIAASLTELESEGVNRSAVATVRLMAMTGWRISEILNLRWENIRSDRGEVFLADTKTGSRWASISTEALVLLSDAPRRGDYVFPGRSTAGHISYATIARVLDCACKRAKVPDVSPHVFRATAATAMAEAGASVFALRDIFGWTTLEMPNRYVKRAAQSAREAVAKHGARTAAIMGGQPPAEVLEMDKTQKVRG